MVLRRIVRPNADFDHKNVPPAEAVGAGTFGFWSPCSKSMGANEEKSPAPAVVWLVSQNTCIRATTLLSGQRLIRSVISL